MERKVSDIYKLGSGFIQTKGEYQEANREFQSELRRFREAMADVGDIVTDEDVSRIMKRKNERDNAEQNLIHKMDAHKSICENISKYFDVIGKEKSISIIADGREYIIYYNSDYEFNIDIQPKD
jgi:hypothetical protein